MHVDIRAQGAEDECGRLRKRAEAAEAKLDALAEALREIYEVTRSSGYGPASVAFDIATKALAPDTAKEGAGA
jgi:hypothetical protein